MTDEIKRLPDDPVYVAAQVVALRFLVTALLRREAERTTDPRQFRREIRAGANVLRRTVIVTARADRRRFSRVVADLVDEIADLAVYEPAQSPPSPESGRRRE